MAAIPGLEGVGFGSVDFAGIGSKLFLGIEIIFGMAFLWAIVYFFIIKPRRYNEVVEVINPETKMKILDKGYLKRNRDGTQDYLLRKHKNAKLEIPKVSPFINQKGKPIRQVIKYGPGDFNWANGTEHWDFIKRKIVDYDIINLTDQNWNKDKIRKETEKKNATTGIKQYIPQIMIGAVIVMFIISAYFITGVMKQGIGAASSSISKSDEVARLNAETAQTLARVYKVENGPNTGPPPLT